MRIPVKLKSQYNIFSNENDLGMLSPKRQPFCNGLDVINDSNRICFENAAADISWYQLH